MAERKPITHAEGRKAQSGAGPIVLVTRQHRIDRLEDCRGVRGQVPSCGVGREATEGEGSRDRSHRV